MKFYNATSAQDVATPIGFVQTTFKSKDGEENIVFREYVRLFELNYAIWTSLAYTAQGYYISTIVV